MRIMSRPPLGFEALSESPTTGKWGSRRGVGRDAGGCSARGRCPRTNAADALDGVAHDVARTLRRGELGVGRDVDLRQAVEQVPCIVARLNGGPCPQYGILVQELTGH